MSTQAMFSGYQHPLRLRFLGSALPGFFGRGMAKRVPEFSLSGSTPNFVRAEVDLREAVGEWRKGCSSLSGGTRHKNEGCPLEEGAKGVHIFVVSQHRIVKSTVTETKGHNKRGKGSRDSGDKSGMACISRGSRRPREIAVAPISFRSSCYSYCVSLCGSR